MFQLNLISGFYGSHISRKMEAQDRQMDG